MSSMSLFYMHMAFGVFSTIVNNISNYVFQKDIIPTNMYSDQDTKIIGTWNLLETSNINKASESCTLSTLFKITSPDSKCTQTMVDKYAFILGKLMTSYYFWMKMTDDEYVYISFTQSGLYTKW